MVERESKQTGIDNTLYKLVIHQSHFFFLQFPNYEIVVTGLRDEFPKWLKGKTSILTLIVIVFAFVLAIPQTFQVTRYLALHCIQ